MELFYYSQDWGTILDVPHILLSYGVVRHKNGAIKKYDLSHANTIFLDCGAYSLRGKLKTYPLDSYIDWILNFPNVVDHVATVDIIGDHIQTAKMGIDCLNSDSRIPWVPVLQGKTIREYLDCLKFYDSKGVDLSGLVAVGGLKGKHPLFIRSLLSSLSSLKIHAFGLTLNNLRDPTIWNSIFSTDSGTWKKRPQSTYEKYNQLEQFKKNLAVLTNSYFEQTQL